MRPQHYKVLLTSDERTRLEKFVATGHAPATSLTHARILLKADHSATGPAWTDAALAAALDVGLSTVARVRRRYVEAGLDAALKRAPTTRVYDRALDGAQEAHLIALACLAPVEGQAKWSLRLLADKMIELGHADQLSHETVRRVLKKTTSSRT